MKRLALVIAFLVSGIAAALAQTTVSVIGTVTSGDCVIFNSQTIIKDAGFNCSGAPGGAAGGVLGGTYPNPTFSASVQSALTGTNTGILFGTGAFGFSSTSAPVRAGDIVYWNGSTWVTLAGNNSGTQILAENASGVPSWTVAGSGNVSTSGSPVAGQGAVFASATTIKGVGPPTSQVFLSGSGTYTTPAGATWIEVTITGGGGGGAGGASGATSGGAGGNSTFNAAAITANGGGPGLISPAAGTGGTASGGDINISGGGGYNSNGQFGGYGASSAWGGAAGPTGGGAYGAGGSGGGVATAGGAGGAGGTAKKIIASPSATYTYAVGAGGTAGAAGSGGGPGIAGIGGIIAVVEHYGS